MKINNVINITLHICVIIIYNTYNFMYTIYMISTHFTSVPCRCMVARRILRRNSISAKYWPTFIQQRWSKSHHSICFVSGFMSGTGVLQRYLLLNPQKTKSIRVISGVWAGAVGPLWLIQHLGKVLYRKSLVLENECGGRASPAWFFPWVNFVLSTLPLPTLPPT